MQFTENQLKKENLINKIMQNIKSITIMKSAGKSDKEIAQFINTDTATFLNCIESEPYLKEVYENASAKFASELEDKFLNKVMESLEEGDTTDAKWVLERTTQKYSKKETLNLNHKTIDEIINEHDKQQNI